MDLIFDNSIAQMPGPEFLRLYWTFSAVLLVLSWWLARYGGGQSDDGQAHRLDNDAYAAAFLRGGKAELARLAITELLQKGVVRLDGRELEPVEGVRSAKAKLSPIAEAAHKWMLGQRVALANVFRPTQLPSQLDDHADTLKDRLEKARLLIDDGIRGFRLRLFGFATLLLLGLGVFKIAVALSKGRTNVGFLVLSMIVAFIVLLIVVIGAPRCTRKGRRYLKDLRFAFADFRDQLPDSPQAQLDPRFLLAVGLFGVGALAGTAHAAFADELKRLNMSSGSCSSSGSSSSCSSGGDSGGDSGGGGCGGCGGGGGD